MKGELIGPKEWDNMTPEQRVEDAKQMVKNLEKLLGLKLS